MACNNVKRARCAAFCKDIITLHVKVRYLRRGRWIQPCDLHLEEARQSFSEALLTSASRPSLPQVLTEEDHTHLRQQGDRKTDTGTQRHRHRRSAYIHIRRHPPIVHTHGTPNLVPK